MLAKLFLMQVVLLVLLGTGELGARLWLDHGASDEAFKRFASQAQLRERFGEGDSQRFAPHRYLGYALGTVPADGDTHYNSLGYRGEEFPAAKPEGEIRIVCIGGSTTYTSEVFDDGFTYPATMEKTLHAGGRTDVRVVNAGVGGWNTWESLVNFQLRVLDLDPDLIVIYHAINDVHARIVWPATAYRGDDSGRRGRFVLHPTMPPLWKRSALARILAVSWISPVRLLFDAGAPTFYADHFRSQLKRGVYPRQIFQNVSVERMLETNAPVYYRRNLENMIAIARQQGVAVVLATFAWSRDFSEQPRSSSDEYELALNEMNAVMRAVGAENDVPVFDFTAVFPRTRDRFADGRHVNVRGSVLKGRLFGEFLLEQELVPDRVPDRGEVDR